jgi:putative ABC transport system ATP-binding protein
METVLKVENISKIYKTPNKEIYVLHDINFQIESHSTCAIIGPSGSGKTTLLGLCAGLDRSSSGSIEITGIKLDELSEDERARLRNDKLGFVFQNFQLMPTLTALENVMIPAELGLVDKPYEQAELLLDKVGLVDRMDHYPVQLSGGEQQRVALARAFINSPQILFADEPTGNLDGETSEKIIQLMFELNREQGTTLVLVTHNLELAEKCHRIIHLKSGRIVRDSKGAARENVQKINTR